MWLMLKTLCVMVFPLILIKSRLVWLLIMYRSLLKVNGMFRQMVLEVVNRYGRDFEL